MTILAIWLAAALCCVGGGFLSERGQTDAQQVAGSLGFAFGVLLILAGSVLSAVALVEGVAG